MTAVAVVTVGCTGTDKGRQTTVAGQLPRDTVYTKKAAMSIYGYQPLRALQIVDSAVIVGNIGEVQADQCRARIYGMSLMTDQLDSLNEHGNMLDAFTQIENSVHEATAREHQERVGAIFSKGSEYAKMSSYVLQLRLDYAAQLLLKHPDKSIVHIATVSGFSTSAYFSNCFRHHFGMTPTEYRHAANNP